MGRRDTKYHKNLKQQMYTIFTDMLHAGEGSSKRAAVLDGTAKDKIFSYNTYKTYTKHCYYFAEYIQKEHPECTTLKKARQYVNEWLALRVNQTNDKGEHLSAWTIQTEAKALAKLYGIQPDDEDYFQAPKRNRYDIKRSRGPVERDKHFSELNNLEFVNFCKGTGCRRNIMEKLEGRDLYSRDDMIRRMDALCNRQALTEKEGKELDALEDALNNFPQTEYFVNHRNDKGGRDRYAPIIGPNADQIINRFKDTKPTEKVWLYVPTNADIHSYRGEYATAIYKMHARDIKDIPYDRVNRGTGKKFQSGVYVCRKDEKGKKLDKDAMLLASKALGHNRIEIVANNYIRGL